MQSTSCRWSRSPAASRTGETHITGAAELRHKESDRIATVVAAIQALGGEAEALDDGLVVTGSGGLRGGRVDSHGDHRLAMLGAVAGLASRDGVTVAGMDAAGVSYPGFERDLRFAAAAESLVRAPTRMPLAGPGGEHQHET